MNKRNTTLSIAAVFAASVLALQAPVVGAQGTSTATSNTSQSATSQQGVPGVEMNVGNNASDRGLPGVEMNVGAQGDQKNVDTGTLGAGADTGTSTETSDSTLSPRADRG